MSIISSALMLGGIGKTINIQSLTLSDSPQAERFTSGVFTVAMTTDKTATSIKAKAWLVGAIKAPSMMPGTVQSIDSTIPAATYSSTMTGAQSPTGMFDGNLDGSWAQTGSTCLWDASSYGLSGVVRLRGTNALTIDHSFRINGSTVTFNHRVNPAWKTYNSYNPLTSIGWTRGANSSPAVLGVEVGGRLLLDNTPTVNVTMTDPLGTVALMDSFVTSSGANGVIVGFSGSTLALGVKGGTVNVGDTIELTNRLGTDTSIKTGYLQFASNGAVSSTAQPTASDIGFQPFSMTGAYTGTLTFPASVVGTVTDTAFPAGTQLNIQLEVSDGISKDVSTVVSRIPA
ncbi:hypothetical protein S-CBP2_0043 [Synechococcus phage S-CBP2]|uniref:Uncharacterized protein n=1 Tax=Synechococcus phage S-CBP2 TaxID=756277 RepID=A0A096VL07_9CAUD|nr:hypothetical protein S-CBP2_0043 [Synechococcus phage S-CBP2]AGF91075.1 hypothetical protein SXHG_00053 [Synechococcus phage MRHenn-2013a]AGK86749.1 hypothetical protein S-CBP2_0043 [Synechococcus phage S-CBP2]